jgi:hypothetical protein
LGAAHGNQNVISSRQISTVDKKFNGSRLEILSGECGVVEKERYNPAAER